MPAKIDIKIEGDVNPGNSFGGFYYRVALVTKTLGDGYEEGTRKATKYLFEKTQMLVPVKTGALKASGYHLVVGQGFSAQGFVGYKDPKGIYVHEVVTNIHAPPTQAKFVEAPARMYRKEMMQHIRREIEKAWIRNLKNRGTE